MTAMGHKRTSRYVRVMSALPPKADIAGRKLNVRFVPQADIALRVAGRKNDKRRQSGRPGR
jgi:hypothetical protein